MREGLNTGLVIVGKIGDTTNVAARLLQHAGPGQIVISEATHRLVEGYGHTSARTAVPPGEERADPRLGGDLTAGSTDLSGGGG